MLSIFEAYVVGQSRTKQQSSKSKKKTKEELLKMDQNDMFMELIREITNELDVNVLCHKILVNVGYMTHCERGSLFLRRGDKKNRYLAAKLFDVTETSTLAETLQPDDKSIKIPFGVGIAGSVAATKEPINIPDAYADPRFNRDVDKKTGIRTRNILCMPLLDNEGEVLGVAQIMNKSKGDYFTQDDEKIFKNYLAFCSIGLANAQLFELSTTETKQNQLLLQLAQGIFREHRSLERLVMRILMDAQELLWCEKCCVYITRMSVHEKIELTRGYVMEANIPKKIISLSREDLSKARSAFFATEAATSGEPFVIEDALSDPTYQKEIIDFDGFAMKSVLAVPILNGEDDIVGVVQMLNKGGGKPFSDVDVSTVKTFAIFCGLGMHHCELFGDVSKLLARQQVAMDVLSYHSSASKEETDRLDSVEVGSAKSYKLYDFMFMEYDLSDVMELWKCVIRMFLELDVLSTFAIPYKTLCRFVLTVKKNYRSVEVHDFRHAVQVTQSMFVMITKGKFSRHLNSVSKFCLMIGALCHDLDHRGPEESNMINSDTPYSTLYYSSVCQRHHFDRLCDILKDPACNILADTDQRKVRQMIEEIIVATDFTVMAEVRAEFKLLLLKPKKENWKEHRSNYLLRCMLIGAADLCSVCKPWECQPRMTHLTNDYIEYCQQLNDDDETEDRTSKPEFKTLQRRNEEISKYHLEFVNKMCLEHYQLLLKVEGAIGSMVRQLQRNASNWKKLEEERKDIQTEAVEQEAEASWKEKFIRRMSSFTRRRDTVETEELPELTRNYAGEPDEKTGVRTSAGLFEPDREKKEKRTTVVMSETSQ